MSQLENLKTLATQGVVFWFISDTQVGTRMPGSELVQYVKGFLTPQEVTHLKGQVVAFKAAEFRTTDPILALAVLHAKERLGAVPAKWELPTEPVAPPVPEAVAVPAPDPEPEPMVEVPEEKPEPVVAPPPVMPNSSPKRRARRPKT